MTKQEFLKAFTEALECDPGEIAFDTPLSEVGNYDSFAIMSLISLIHKTFDLRLKGDQLASVESVNQLMDIIGLDKFE